MRQGESRLRESISGRGLASTSGRPDLADIPQGQDGDFRIHQIERAGALSDQNTNGVRLRNSLSAFLADLIKILAQGIPLGFGFRIAFTSLSPSIRLTDRVPTLGKRQPQWERGGHERTD